MLHVHPISGSATAFVLKLRMKQDLSRGITGNYSNFQIISANIKRKFLVLILAICLKMSIREYELNVPVHDDGAVRLSVGQIRRHLVPDTRPQ